MNAVEKSGLLVLKWSDYYVESASSSSETSKYFSRIIKYSENYRDEKKACLRPWPWECGGMSQVHLLICDCSHDVSR
jgi:hypothetical protein